MWRQAQSSSSATRSGRPFHSVSTGRSRPERTGIIGAPAPAPMTAMGLTGGIGMGKSTAADLLRQRGLPVIDNDLIARQLVEPGQPVLAEIRQPFGLEISGAAGRLRRDELARRVFADAESRRRLEEVLHPRIRAIWQAQL